MSSGCGGYVKIRVDLESAFALTEFCLPATVSKNSQIPDNDKTSIEDAPTLALKTMAEIKRSHKKPPLGREKSITLMMNNNAVRGQDVDSGNWQVDCDLNSSFLRCAMVNLDMNKIPRNHLRYFFDLQRQESAGLFGMIGMVIDNTNSF